MIKIAQAFQNQKALIAYLMAGDPDLKTSAEYILTAQEAGADMIQIGIPFSDPIAETEVVQTANMRALEAGTRLDGVFDMVASIKDQMRVPMVFMTYLNPVFAYGYDRFFAHCADIGICGIIVPDMPFEEQEEAKQFARKHSIEIMTILAPTSDKRMAKMVENAEGFICLTSCAGMTDACNANAADQSTMIAGVKKISDIPVAVDFETPTPEQAGHFHSTADGFIVGSGIVNIIGQYGNQAKQALYEHIKATKGKIASK